MTHEPAAMTSQADDGTTRRTEFGPLLWGHRGEGIDIQASCLMYGLRIGRLFLGALYKDQPLASSSPVSRYQAMPTAKNHEA